MKTGIFYLFISGALWIFSGFALNIGIGRLLGPELYGTYGAIIALLSLIFPLLGNGLRQAVAKYASSELLNAGSILFTGLKIQIIASLTLGAILFLFSVPISHLFSDPGLAKFIRVGSILLPLYGVMNIYMGFLEGSSQFGKLAFVSTTYSISRIFIIFLLIYLGFAIYGVIVGMIFSIFLAALIGSLLCKGQQYNSRFDAMVLLKFAVPVLVFFVVVDFLSYMDVLMVKGILADNAKTGFYTSAKSISRFVYFLIIPFSIVLLPLISRSIAEDDYTSAEKYVSDSIRYLLIWLLPVISVLATTSEKIVVLVYGSSYAPAAFPLCILVIGMCFWSITSVLSTIIQGYGAPKIPTIIFAVIIPIDVFLQSILIPRFSLEGAAIATAATFLIGFIVSGIFISRIFKKVIIIKSFFKILLSASIIAVIAPHISTSGPLLLVCYVALFTIYLALLLLFGEITEKDKSFLKAFLRELLTYNNHGTNQLE